jgi:acetyl-CoA synthetase
VVVVDALPKTRSGKILRRLLLGVTRGEEAGDTTSLVDPEGFAALAADYRTLTGTR